MIKNSKYLKLISYLKDLESVLIAFSGGVDSTFLLKATKESLGDNVKAVTIASPYIPKWEIEEAKELVDEIGIIHEVVEVGINNELRNNPENRCYICKKFIFSNIKKIAKEQGYKYVIDGSNFDDTKVYRPGLVALRELDIKSPLIEVKLTKHEIRKLSKKLSLKTWDKPACACLLTRIPYNNELKIKDLDKIERAEKYMIDKGFREVRVRCHNDLVRIEVNKNDRRKLFEEKILDEISSKLKVIGFKYITMDLQGYRLGSFDETISNNGIISY